MQWFRRLRDSIRRLRCRHVFRGVDMPPRDGDGKVRWPCSKCGQVFAMDYGLQAPGAITGPWGSVNRQASAPSGTPRS